MIRIPYSMKTQLCNKIVLKITSDYKLVFDGQMTMRYQCSVIHYCQWYIIIPKDQIIQVNSISIRTNKKGWLFPQIESVSVGTAGPFCEINLPLSVYFSEWSSLRILIYRSQEMYFFKSHIILYFNTSFIFTASYRDMSCTCVQSNPIWKQWYY